MQYIIGIDVAKKSHQATVMNRTGKIVLNSFAFKNSREGFVLFLKKISDVNKNFSLFEIGMEATGHYWINLYTWLSAEKFLVHVINPLQSGALRNLYIRPQKTDSVDAKIIAQVIRIGKYSETQLCDERLLAVRDLSRQRIFLSDLTADLKRKVIAMTDRIFPEYQDFFADTFSKTSAQILRTCPSAREILNLKTEELSSILRKASRGRFGHGKAALMQDCARNSFAAKFSPRTVSFLVKQTMAQIDLLETQMKILEKRISEEMKNFDTKITQVPGVGTILAACILSEIGDVKRFSSLKKLIAYAGIDPSVQQSGEFLGTENHMSKRGSYYLRRSLWCAAFVAISHDKTIVAVYKKKKAEGKNYFQCMGFVMKKLLSAIYAILKTGCDYDEKKLFSEKDAEE